MVKRLQNRIAESKLALLFTMLYALAVWVLCGLFAAQWWLQLLCFAVTTYLMVEMNNTNALIRIYSRMVSCSFLVMSCCACHLFPSVRGAMLLLCFMASCLMLFQTYQDKESVGHTYYGFLFFGLASMAFVQVLFLLPLLWLLMRTNLLSLSWRTFSASLLGLLTPYWFGACWLVYQEDFTPLIEHFAALADFGQPFGYRVLSLPALLVFAFVAVLMLTGIVHYIRQHHNDSIRIRLLYGFFIWMDVAVMLFLIAQPQHYDALMRIMIAMTAPLIAHFVALTSTKLTNAAYILMVVSAVLLTAYNVWMSSSLF